MTGILIFQPNKTLTVENEFEIHTYRFATFFERLGARFVDILILFIPLMFVPLFPAWFYYCFLQSGKKQASYGQQAFNIQLLSTKGHKIYFDQITGRFFANFLNFFTMGAGFIMFFFSNKKQCLHDSLTNCIVVKKIFSLPKQD